MVNNIVYQFVGSNHGGWDIFEKEGTSEKGCVEIEVEASLYTLYWGFKEIPFTRYTYVSAKILQNGARFIEKLTPGFKIHMRNSDKQWKIQKVEIWWATFVQKIHILPKTLYTEDLSNIHANITFNYLCENSPNYLCHFWNLFIISVTLPTLNLPLWKSHPSSSYCGHKGGTIKLIPYCMIDILYHCSVEHPS